VEGQVEDSGDGVLLGPGVDAFEEGHQGRDGPRFGDQDPVVGPVLGEEAELGSCGSLDSHGGGAQAVDAELDSGLKVLWRDALYDLGGEILPLEEPHAGLGLRIRGRIEVIGVEVGIGEVGEAVELAGDVAAADRVVAKGAGEVEVVEKEVVLGEGGLEGLGGAGGQLPKPYVDGGIGQIEILRDEVAVASGSREMGIRNGGRIGIVVVVRGKEIGADGAHRAAALSPNLGVGIG